MNLSWGRSENIAIGILVAVLNQLLVRSANYRCVNCGFVVKALHWCCPSCQQWNTIKPMPDLVMNTGA